MLVAAASLAAGTGVILSPPAMAARAGGPGAAEAGKVASGAARSLGEPVAAQDGAATAVTATSFGATGAQAVVWTRRAGVAGWQRAGSVLPGGFGSSYDPAAAAAPGGPLLVVAGAAPPGEKCIAGGSVAIASVDSQGKLSAARLVSDQRGTGSFDDRPMVAAGQHGMVWVAWSQGPGADACQDVGTGDRIEVAVSHDAGRTFSAPVAMPAGGGHSAFGVRLAPLPGGQVAVSWTEMTRAGDQGVLVSVLSASGHPGQPELALTGEGPPLVLPGASFYDFPAGDIIALPDGKLMVAAPFWASGRNVIKVAAGTPGGRWRQATLSPSAGADLLLPALGLLPSGGVRLLCAVHDRAGDRLGYDWAVVTVAAGGPAVSPAGLTALTAAPSGPGFFEIGEELALSPVRGGLLTAVVVAGQDGATLETATFSSPPAATTPAGTPTATPATRLGAAPGTSGHSAPATSTPRAASGRPAGSAALAAWLAAAALCCAGAAGALLRWRHRSARTRRRPPSHARQ
jgi:hypothetical protein